MGGPQSDIGYSHIKERRAKEIKVDCCGNKFVGEFVPFYYSPRSIMLFIVNQGETGKPRGHQSEVVHLVSSVASAISGKSQWAISDGNAGSHAAQFSNSLQSLDSLNWDAIQARYWSDVTFEKQAEFLVADFFPLIAFKGIGCYNDDVTRRVQSMLNASGHSIPVATKRDWYY